MHSQKEPKHRDSTLEKQRALLDNKMSPLTKCFKKKRPVPLVRPLVLLLGVMWPRFPKMGAVAKSSPLSRQAVWSVCT